MRILPLACLLLTLSAPALAEDRYGPHNPAIPTYAAAADLPATARLSWRGKVEPAAPTAEAPVVASSAPLADGVLRRTGAYGAAPAAVAPPPPPVAQPAPPVENAPWRRLTGAPAPLAQAPAQPAADAPAGEHARYYSLHREYGETPDAIPAPQKSQIFLAGGPLTAGVGDGEAVEGDSTGKTAALNKARIAADWRASADR